MASLAATIATAGSPLSTPNSFDEPSYVHILDTTLCDGEQAPGAAMTTEQNIYITRNLVLLSIDVINAKFLISSPEDFNAVKSIVDEVGSVKQGGEGGHVPSIAIMARTSKRDINAAWEAVGDAQWLRIATFIATSEIHMKHKLKKSRDEVMAIAAEMVAYARSVGFQDISFAVEDSLRLDKDFLYRIFGEVTKAGAK